MTFRPREIPPKDPKTLPRNPTKESIRQGDIRRKSEFHQEARELAENLGIPFKEALEVVNP